MASDRDIRDFIQFPRGRIGEFVYQNTGIQFANFISPRNPFLQKRIEPTKAQPGTPAQTATWDAMRAAVSAWQALDDIGKAVWRARANSIQHLTGYQLFTRQHLLGFIR